MLDVDETRALELGFKELLEWLLYVDEDESAVCGVVIELEVDFFDLPSTAIALRRAANMRFMSLILITGWLSTKYKDQGNAKED